MHNANRTLVPLLVAILVAAIGGGCSKQARMERHLAHADKYFQSGQLAQAEIEYLNAFNLDRNNPRAIGQLGLIYYDEGRIARAYAFLKRAREMNPKNVELLLKSAMLDLGIGELTRGRSEAEAVLNLSPTNSEAPLLLVDSVRTEKEIGETRQRLDNLRSQIGQTPATDLALGALDLRAGNLQAAEAAFKRAQAQDPKSAATFSAFGTLFLAQGNLTNADEAFKTAADLSPPRSLLRLRYADFKLKTGNVEAAENVLSQITKTAPDFLPAWTGLAEIALARKQYTNSAALLKQALIRDPNDYRALMLRARLQMAQRNMDEAIKELEQVAILYDKSPQIPYQLAIANLEQDDVSKAANNLTKALTLDPNFDQAILLQAQLNLRRDDPEAAIASMTQLIKREPQLPQAHLLLITAYLAKENYSDALAACRRLGEVFPKSADVPLLMGRILARQNDADGARKQFEKALELAPDAVPPLQELVNLDLKAERFDAALQRIEAARWTNSPAIEALRAQVNLAQTNTAGAEEALLKAISYDQNYEPAYLMLARVYASSKQNDKALEKLKEYSARNPRDVPTLMLMGMVQDQLHDYSGARASYEKLLDVNPSFSPALNNLAYLYSERFALLDKAYVAARKARDLSPHDPFAGDTLGWILFKRREYPWALSLLQDSAQKLPDEPEVQFHLGMTYYMMNDQRRAAQALNRALSQNIDFPGKEDAAARLALLNLDVSNPSAKTITDLQRRLTQQPDDPVVPAKLAEVYERQHSPEKAVEAYVQALTRSPNIPGLMIQLASLYSDQLHDSDKALEWAKNAYKLAPDDPQVSHILGRLTFNTGDFNWALSLLQQTAQKQPRDSDVLFDLAYAYYSVGRVNDASDTMQTALSAHSAFTHASAAKEFLNLITAASSSSNALAAEPQAREILRTSPTNVPALMVAALASEQRGDIASARDLYGKIASRYPDFLPAIRRLVILTAESAGNDQRIYDLAMKARQALPDDTEVGKALGTILYNRADFQGAARMLDEGIRNGGPDGKSSYYLGMAYLKLKEDRQSKAALDRAIALGLPTELAEKAKAALAKLGP